MTTYLESLAMSFDFNNITDGTDAQNDSPNAQQPQDNVAASSQPARSSGNVTVYQTTGPDAHTTPILAPGSSGAPAINPRSCVTCRRRKVRCDKQMPCSNCRRAQIPCVFPAPGRAPRQPRPRDPNAPPKNSSQRELELMKRLRKLEGIVEDLSGQIEVESGGKGPSTASSPDATHNPQAGGQERAATLPPRQTSSAALFGCHSDGPRGSDSISENSGDAARRKELHQRFGRLVLTEQTGSRRYVSSGFWTKLNDELDSIRQDTQKLTDEDSDDSDYEGTPETSPSIVAPVDHHAFVLGYRSADVNLAKCHPLASHIPFLWSVYQENVEPLIKVVHVPSMETIFRDARRNQASLTPAQEALVFSIYYAAVTSLEADEVQTHLGCNKEDLLSQFRFAVEQALSKANYLHSTDLTILQAFVIFLVVVRRQDDSRFCWSLIGLVVHLAQGMGLHRDGTHFGLSPFETEMRRRVWWQLLILDLRSADELGADLIISDRGHDTNLPSNINDADITPEMTEFPEEKEGRSDCAVALVRYEICSLSRRLVRASSAFANICPRGMALTAASLPDRERMLIEVYQGIESKFLKNVVLHETDPLYWMAAMIARVIMAKMCLVIYQPMLFPGSDESLTEEARHRVYVAAIEIMEYSHILNSDPRCKQYRWLFMTYTNWHAMAYYLVEAVRRPWTPLVERGWQAFHNYGMVQFARNEDQAAAMMPLKKLSHRVAKHRASEIARLKANPNDAYRLDFEERVNPTHARFGPVPGAEGRMEQIREAWLQMVRPEGSQPWPSPAPPMPQQSPTQQQLLPPPQQQAAPETKSKPSPPRTPPSNKLPSNIELSDATMTMIDDLMSQDSHFPMTAFWPMNDIVANEMKNSNSPATSNGAGVASAAPAASVPQMQSPPLGQQIPTAVTLPKDDNPPPYLWADPFTSMNTSFGDVGAEDTDMLGDEFNWQDWSQSIRGLEMESTQAQKKW
ncbi:fungal-specific transcription factor domain-containing protein [Thelonectria olida]|uniref:Fungal-specific transcription factor domain-containing protein n=1 Tax=Thelonectria olida TaxID=1576542 RepID=A0A9P9AWH4_9HYPO|nr:fungal-specific transcription factor domain-containing protein [Thelonectria olida]